GFRPSKPDDKTKELVEDESGSNDMTLERIEEGTLLSPGQKVRLSIESLSRSGYLYVIDREAYADGSFGEAKLIFPTLKSADANHVAAGRLVFIPSTTGKVTITPSPGTKSHKGREITIFVSPMPPIFKKNI